MMIIPRWCLECSHYQPKDGESSICMLRKCTMKPVYHPEGTDRSDIIMKDCAKIQGWRGKRVLDVLGEVHEREARAAEMLAMKPKHNRKANLTDDPAALASAMCAACVSGPSCGKEYPSCKMYKSRFTHGKRVEAKPCTTDAGIQNTRPTPDQVALAKACQHLHQEEFIDGSFTGLGIMCIDCHLLIRWTERPDWVKAGAPVPPPPFGHRKASDGPRLKTLEAWK